MTQYNDNLGYEIACLNIATSKFCCSTYHSRRKVVILHGVIQQNTNVPHLSQSPLTHLAVVAVGFPSVRLARVEGVTDADTSVGTEATASSSLLSEENMCQPC